MDLSAMASQSQTNQADANKPKPFGGFGSSQGSKPVTFSSATVGPGLFSSQTNANSGTGTFGQMSGNVKPLSFATGGGGAGGGFLAQA